MVERCESVGVCDGDKGEPMSRMPKSPEGMMRMALLDICAKSNDPRIRRFAREIVRLADEWSARETERIEKLSKDFWRSMNNEQQ